MGAVSLANKVFPALLLVQTQLGGSSQVCITTLKPAVTLVHPPSPNASTCSSLVPQMIYAEWSMGGRGEKWNVKNI